LWQPEALIEIKGVAVIGSSKNLDEAQ